MTGLPYEDKEDLVKTTDLILKLISDNPKASVTALGIFTPYPGSDLFDDIVENGYKAPENLQQWSEMLQEKTTLPWLSKKRRKELEALYYLSFFIEPPYLCRHGLSSQRRIYRLCDVRVNRYSIPVEYLDNNIECRR